jgi:hypothetical protein
MLKTWELGWFGLVLASLVHFTASPELKQFPFCFKFHPKHLQTSSTSLAKHPRPQLLPVLFNQFQLVFRLLKAQHTRDIPKLVIHASSQDGKHLKLIGITTTTKRRARILLIINLFCADSKADRIHKFHLMAFQSNQAVEGDAMGVN